MTYMTAHPTPTHEALAAAAADATLPDQVLTQWFGSARPGNAQALQYKSRWFTKSPAFDEELRERFGVAVEAALGGALQHWSAQGPWPHLALALALQAMQSGADQQLPEVVRVFMYLPLEHAEDPAMQQRCVAAFDAMHQAAEDAELREYLAGSLDYAHRHQVVIEQFCRFPHRNAILGRTSTAEEAAYLAQPGSGF